MFLAKPVGVIVNPLRYLQCQFGSCLASDYANNIRSVEYAGYRGIVLTFCPFAQRAFKLFIRPYAGYLKILAALITGSKNGDRYSDGPGDQRANDGAADSVRQKHKNHLFPADSIAQSGRRDKPRKEVKTMSEKEKAMIEKIAQLPPELQNRIVDQIDGAIMAMDMLADGKTEKEASA